MLHKVIELNRHSETVIKSPLEDLRSRYSSSKFENVSNVGLPAEQTLTEEFQGYFHAAMELVGCTGTTSLEQPSNPLYALLQRHIGATQEQKASAFIREALQSRIKEKHLKYRTNIIQKILNNNKIIERDKIKTPLSDLEKEGLITLIDKVYGGCVHTLGKNPSFQKVIKIAKHVYNETKFQCIRVGVIADKLKELMPALGINTLRKIVKKHAPLSAQKFGRHSKDDKDCVNQFIAQEYNLLAN